MSFFKKMAVASSLASFFFKARNHKGNLVDFKAVSDDLLEALDVQVHLRGKLPAKPCLIVANHLSYLDIPLLCRLAPMRFVTSVELAAEKLTGHIARGGGSIFVERRNYSTLLRDIDRMTECLKNGENVCFFPEATTSDGTMLPWRSSLFEAAVRAQVAVVPIAIKYVEINGQHLKQSNKDLLYYYKGMTFGSHFSTLLKQKNIKVRVTICRPIQGESRKKLALLARHLVAGLL